MSLKGRYIHGDDESNRVELSIDRADNRTGKLEGKLWYPLLPRTKTEFSVTGHYHFVGGSVEHTILWINAVHAADGVRVYLSFTGWTNEAEPKKLRVRGTIAHVDSGPVRLVRKSDVDYFRRVGRRAGEGGKT